MNTNCGQKYDEIQMIYLYYNFCMDAILDADIWKYEAITLAKDLSHNMNGSEDILFRPPIFLMKRRLFFYIFFFCRIYGKTWRWKPNTINNQILSVDAHKLYKKRAKLWGDNHSHIKYHLESTSDKLALPTVKSKYTHCT